MKRTFLISLLAFAACTKPQDNPTPLEPGVLVRIDNWDLSFRKGAEPVAEGFAVMNVSQRFPGVSYVYPVTVRMSDSTFSSTTVKDAQAVVMATRLLSGWRFAGVKKLR